MAENTPTYYQSRHTGEDIDNLLDHSPSGSPLHDLFVAKGAVWNASTGYWELNGLTDITTEQMVYIYNMNSIQLMGGRAASVSQTMKFGRTNFPFSAPVLYPSEKYYTWFYLMWNNTTEVIRFTSYSQYQPSTISFISNNWDVIGIEYFNKLRKIEDILDITNVVKREFFLSGCESLEIIRLKGVHINQSMAASSKLAIESLQYLVENAANTGAITVTVHADVYAKLTDPSNTEWYAVNTAAQAKRISFATA